MSQESDLIGGCLCGGVRFVHAGAFDRALGAVTVCHCGRRRKAQGYAAAVVPVLAEALTITAGADLVREYESSRGKRRAFCGRCGSPLYSRLDTKAGPSAAAPGDAGRCAGRSADRGPHLHRGWAGLGPWYNFR